MHAHSFPIDLKFRFSQLINDYIVEDKKLKSYYSQSPRLENFENQINQKKSVFYKGEPRSFNDNLQKSV